MYKFECEAVMKIPFEDKAIFDGCIPVLWMYMVQDIYTIHTL